MDGDYIERRPTKPFVQNQVFQNRVLRRVDYSSKAVKKHEAIGYRGLKVHTRQTSIVQLSREIKLSTKAQCDVGVFNVLYMLETYFL